MTTYRLIAVDGHAKRNITQTTKAETEDGATNAGVYPMHALLLLITSRNKGESLHTFAVVIPNMIKPPLIQTAGKWFS